MARPDDSGQVAEEAAEQAQADDHGEQDEHQEPRAERRTLDLVQRRGEAARPSAGLRGSVGWTWQASVFDVGHSDRRGSITSGSSRRITPLPITRAVMPPVRTLSACGGRCAFPGVRRVGTSQWFPAARRGATVLQAEQVDAGDGDVAAHLVGQQRPAQQGTGASMCSHCTRVTWRGGCGWSPVSPRPRRASTASSSWIGARLPERTPIHFTRPSLTGLPRRRTGCCGRGWRAGIRGAG